MNKILIVIPSRLASVRLPEKPLALINDKPMIQWVYEAANRISIPADIVVATDSKKIYECVFGFGGKAVMTSESCQNGTERVYQAFKDLGGMHNIVLNLQGDEPMMSEEVLESAILQVTKKGFDIGTGVTDIVNTDELKSNGCVKVLADHKMRAIYFSRYPIPYSMQSPDSFDPKQKVVFRHLGLYVYKKEVLESFVNAPQTILERAESLEQLRALYLGYTIGLGYVPGFSGVSVDTKEDLQKVRDALLR